MSNYKFEENSTSDPVPVIITEGKYSGIKYSYGSIKFEEEKDGMRLVFDYDILENTTSFEKSELDETEEFHNMLGDILVDIIGSELSRGDDFLREPIKSDE